MKQKYIVPQCEQVVLNVNGEILDSHFGNQSGVTVEPSTEGSGSQGSSEGGGGGFEATESRWGDIEFTPWED